MTKKFEHLFSPIQIGKLKIKNRTAMMAMAVFSKRMMNQDGSFTKDGADYFITRAKGGVGLLISGLIGVIGYTDRPFINKDPESYIKNQRYLMDGIHKYGAKMFIQLTAGTGRVTKDPKDPVAPSQLPNVWDPTIIHREMTKEEIHNMVKAFGQGALNVKRAGGDGVEIHAVHEGYLLDQFSQSITNQRTDEYGGSLENRLRFTCEIVQEIKRVCGQDFPVFLRYSVRSYMKEFNRGALPGEKFKEVGRDLPESRLAAQILEKAGYDALDCDNGCYDAWFWPHPPTYMPKACNLADVKEIKKVVSIPVICAGRFDNPAVADSCIANGEIDMMGMGRPLLADPEAVNKFAKDEVDDVRPCISCHMGCFGRIYRLPEEGNDISCALNPACGKEKSMALKPAAKIKKILVVGGGIAGMEAARVCALRGHTVDLYEKTGELGGVFIAAAMPDFKEDDRKLLKWYKKQIKDTGVHVHLNTEITPKVVKKGGYDEIFVATGAKERKLAIPDLQKHNVFYAKEALMRKDIPGRDILIIGGGLTGCEIAYALGKRGKRVTIFEAMDTILNVYGLSATNFNMLLEAIDYYKIKVYTGTTLQSYDGKIVQAVQIIKNNLNCAGRAMNRIAFGPQGRAKHITVNADTIIVSVGYISDQILYKELQGPHTYLLGDAEHPANVMNAIWTAYDIASKI